MRRIGPFPGAFAGMLGLHALDMALSNAFVEPLYGRRTARRGHAALLPKPEHALPEGKCGYRPTGGKRAARRQRAKAK